MKRIALKGNIVLPKKILKGGVVVIEGGKIVEVQSPKQNLLKKETILFDYGQNFIVPGLIDLHLHGALGKDVMDGEVESLEIIAFHQARCGVTGFLPTTLASSLDSILKAVEAVKKAKKLRLKSEILGLHLEGPFLSQEKKGAQDPDFIKAINAEDLNRLLKASKGLKTLLTLAPEVDRNLSFVRKLRERGFILSIGHSDATYDQALASFEEGITNATHLFNAMREFRPREPGAVGAVLDSKKVTAEVIADGIHLHPASLRLALCRKGVEKICLVTDSLKAVGLGDGIFRMGNLEIVVKGNEARLKESGILAGSVLTLNRAVKNIIDWTGVSVSEAVNMASLNPARILGLNQEMGSIEQAKWANLAVFDRNFRVIATLLKGRSVFKEEKI